MPRQNREQLIAMIRNRVPSSGIDANIAVEQARRESVNFDPFYVFGPGKSPAGAMGLWQFIPATARRFGLVNPYDPGQATEAYCSYMGFLLAKFQGRYDCALAAYNWGENHPQTFNKALSEGKPITSYSIPAETRTYVNTILRNAGRLDLLMITPGGESGVIVAASDIPIEDSGIVEVSGTVDESGQIYDLPEEFPVDSGFDSGWLPLGIGIAAILALGFAVWRS